MLHQMRQFTRSKVAVILIGLLVVAFAVWGIEDVFRGGSNTDAVSGKGVSVAADDVQRQFERQLRAVQNQARAQGQPLPTRDEAVEQGLHRRIAEQLAGEAVFARLGERLGLTSSDAMVAKVIQEDPTFVSELTGRFDPATYRRLLAENRISELDYQEDLRDALTRQQLARAFVAGVRAPSSFGTLLATFERERRSFSAAAIPAENVPQPAAPTDEQLQTFYDEQKEQFALPEFRALTIVSADPAAFAARLTVPEERIVEAYEFQKSRVSTPEVRSFVQLSGADGRAEAEAAARRLAQGEAPQAIATDLGLQVIEGADRPRSEITDPRVADAVFRLAPGGTQAVEGLAWSAVRLTSITPATTPTLEELRPAIVADLARQEAQGLIQDAEEQFQDLLDEGVAFEDAARRSGLVVSQTPPISAEGRTPDGQTVQSFPGGAPALTAAFETLEGEASDWIAGAEGVSHMVRVTEVRPAGAPPLAEIRDAVAASWRGREIGLAMRRAGEQIEASVKTGVSFEAAARAVRAIMLPPQDVDRSALRNSPSPMLLNAVFSAQEGDVVTGFGAGQAPVLFVAVVTGIVRPELDAAEVEPLRTALTEALSSDLLGAVERAGRNAFDLRVNTAVLDRTFGSNDEADTQ
jgi:peptidyl-prolyl cis-trans isomerase D